MTGFIAVYIQYNCSSHFTKVNISKMCVKHWTTECVLQSQAPVRLQLA